MCIFEPQVTVAKIAAMDRDGKLPSLDGLREADRYTVLARRLDLVPIPTAIVGLQPDPAKVRLGELDHVNATPAPARPECVALEPTRAGGSAQLVTDGRVTVTVLGDGNLGMRIEPRPTAACPARTCSPGSTPGRGCSTSGRSTVRSTAVPYASPCPRVPRASAASRACREAPPR